MKAVDSTKSWKFSPEPNPAQASERTKSSTANENHFVEHSSPFVQKCITNKVNGFVKIKIIEFKDTTK